MDGLVNLLVPFIALAIFSVLVDRATLVLEEIMHKIPKLPDHLEWECAYAIVVILAYLICYFGDFGIFVYLDILFKYKWIDYLLTALMISGGSVYLRQQFTAINEVPSVLSGVMSSIKSIFIK